MEQSDIHKLIGNPKITCVLGGPGSGKGTQCGKLVEQFGYKHISIGDLMRAQIQKGSKEGELAKSLVKEGKLVPSQLTVGLLVKAMIANPSKNYLIDGFPRQVDQALYFEKNVLELQTILNYSAPQQIIIERLIERGKTSGRSDDNPEAIKKRIVEFNQKTRPVIQFYQRFGKIRNINALGQISDVYKRTKEALMPQIDCILGPCGSGKSTIAAELANRTNMKIINFKNFVWKNYKNRKNDDDFLTQKLIDHLRDETTPRVLLQEFPQNLHQAKFFIRNCVRPGHIFYLKASEDICQSRMITLGKDHPKYISSSDLAFANKKFNQHLPELINYLSTKHQSVFKTINSDQSFNLVFKEVCQHLEPVIVHVRHGTNNQLRKEIINSLCQNHNFINLEVNQLQSDETNRGTKAGIEFQKLLSTGKIISARQTVQMLQKIVYSGTGGDRFLLSGFPDIIEQAEEFQNNCSRISSIIFPAIPGASVDINLSLFNMDTYFQKDGRLKVLTQWNAEGEYQEQLGRKIRYHIVVGGPGTGKTTIAKHLSKSLGWELVDWGKVVESAKSKQKKGGDDDDADQVPLTDQDVMNQAACWISDEKKIYILDGFPQSGTTQMGEALIQALKIEPESFIDLDCEDAKLVDRFKKKNQIDGDLGQQQQEQVNAQLATSHKIKEWVESYTNSHQNIKITQVITSLSQEKGKQMGLSHFSPRIVMLRHDKKFATDTASSNLSLKYGFIYISVYQLIKKHILSETEIGKKLLQTKSTSRSISLDYSLKDQFQEVNYSAALFDTTLVLQMLKQRIDEVRQDQKIILIEGMLNHQKLKEEDEKLQLRFMDQLFSIQKTLGSIQSLILLNTGREDTAQDIEYEELPQPDQTLNSEQKKGGNDDDDDADAVDATGDEEDKKEPSFKVEDYKWSNTDRKPRPLAQLFYKYKRCGVCQVHPSQDFSNNQYDAVNASLDNIMGRIVNGDLNDVTSMVQICFREG